MTEENINPSHRSSGTHPLVRLRRFFGGGQMSKRRNNIQVLRLELEAEREQLDRLGDDTYWYDQALEVLSNQEDAVEQGVPISSSYIYYLVQRLAVLGLVDQDAPSSETESNTRNRLQMYRQQLLQTKAHAAYIDATEKLGSWRKEMIQDLLTTDGKVKSDLTALEVYVAFQALREFSDSRDLIFGKLKRQLAYFISIALSTVSVLLIALLYIPEVSGPLFGETVDVDAARFLVPIVLFGVLGASANAILSLFNQAFRGQIVETQQLFGLPLAFARAVAGAISALLFFAILKSGIFAINFEPWLALAFAFAAGFSEELVRNAVSAISGQVSPSERDSRR